MTISSTIVRLVIGFRLAPIPSLPKKCGGPRGPPGIILLRYGCSVACSVLIDGGHVAIAALRNSGCVIKTDLRQH